MTDISIIIPAYNSAGYLPACLDSCLAQTFDNFEIIVVNDGSKDNTEDILEHYKVKDCRIKIVNKENEGLVKARRTGISYAKGEFVFFLDSDDTIEPDTLELLHSESDCDIVIGNMLLEDEKGNKFMQHYNELKYGNDNEGMYRNYLEKKITPSLCGRLIRRSLLACIEIDGDYTVGEDVITNFMILGKYNVKVGIVDKYLYHYIQREGSMVNTYSVKTLLQRTKYVMYVVSLLDNIKVDLGDSLTEFVINEYYTFLRFGGDKTIDKDFIFMVKKHFWNMKLIRKMSIWKYLMLMSFEVSDLAGKIYRNLFFFLRRFI